MPRHHELRRGPYARKRAVDLALLAVLALPATALGALCAAAIAASRDGPILFRQERIGRDGRSFRVWKFRTMVDAPDNPLFPDDARITKIGRWLRRLSLDELPQLINVARGEMSIVGPRPAMPYQFERLDRRQRERHEVRPGITGLAQISGRNQLTWARRIELDLEYIARQSPRTDLEIVVKTIGAVIGGSGVDGHPADDPVAMPPPEAKP